MGGLRLILGCALGLGEVRLNGSVAQLAVGVPCEGDRV